MNLDLDFPPPLVSELLACCYHTAQSGQAKLGQCAVRQEPLSLLVNQPEPQCVHMLFRLSTERCNLPLFGNKPFSHLGSTSTYSSEGIQHYMEPGAKHPEDSLPPRKMTWQALPHIPNSLPDNRAPRSTSASRRNSTRKTLFPSYGFLTFKNLNRIPLGLGFS